MKKTIYIHIGTPKTGSTSIQRFLTKHRDALSQQGILYPVAGRCYTAPRNGIVEIVPCQEAAQGTKDFNICMNGGVVNNIHDLHTLLSHFEKTHHSTMILSEECLFMQHGNSSIVHNEEVWRLLSTYETKVIVYIRRSIEYLCSLWQEGIKYRSQTKLLDFLDNEDYREHLKNFNELAERVGNKNIIVRTFEKEAWTDNNLIADFLSVFDKENLCTLQEAEIVENSGYTRNQCEKILYINRSLGLEMNDIDIYGINDRVLAGREDVSVIDSLSDDIIEKFTQGYNEEECEIARKFLGRDELFLSKYPKIYQKPRAVFDTEIPESEKTELRFIVSSTLQRQMLKEQKQMMETQQVLLNKTVEVQYSLFNRCSPLEKGRRYISKAKQSISYRLRSLKQS